MGIQICIERKDLEEAGWTCSVEEERYPDPYSDDGLPLFIHRFMVISKGDVSLASYAEDCFCADANHWGNNRKMFKELGLLDLPHTEG